MGADILITRVHGPDVSTLGFGEKNVAGQLYERGLPHQVTVWCLRNQRENEFHQAQHGTTRMEDERWNKKQKIKDTSRDKRTRFY
jgi:hypothetical protein